MDAIFAIHLRGVADPIPPVPLLDQDAVDAVKPARTLIKLSYMIAVFGEPHKTRSTLGIKVADNKKADFYCPRW